MLNQKMLWKEVIVYISTIDTETVKELKLQDIS